MEQAQANGVDDLALLTADQARTLEPQLACVAAFHSPSTGIIDTHGLMLSLLGEAEARGAALARHAPVERGWLEDDGRVTLQVGGADPMQVTARLLVNAAGLGAQGIARALQGYPADRIPPLHYAKGNYFSLGGPSPFSRLIYPMPEAAGLGVHLTLDLAGQARFGPDVEWIDQPRLRRRPAARRCVLRRHPHLLAAPARRRAAARLRRHPPQDPGAGRSGRRLPHRRAGGAWPARAGASLWHRVSGTDIEVSPSPMRSRRDSASDRSGWKPAF